MCGPRMERGLAGGHHAVQLRVGSPQLPLPCFSYPGLPVAKDGIPGLSSKAGLRPGSGLHLRPEAGSPPGPEAGGPPWGWSPVWKRCSGPAWEPWGLGTCPHPASGSLPRESPTGSRAVLCGGGTCGPAPSKAPTMKLPLQLHPTVYCFN